MFLPLSGILKISEKKKETVKKKRAIRHEGTSKIENLFKLIVTNASISFGESDRIVLQGRMPFLNMLDTLFEF